jgi:hypothetical protein
MSTISARTPAGTSSQRVDSWAFPRPSANGEKSGAATTFDGFVVGAN